MKRRDWRGVRITDSFKEETFDEEHAVSDHEVKTAPKAIEINK